jgi:SAM-dependent methyltransferase
VGAGSLPPLSIMGSLRWDTVQRLLPADRDLDLLEIGCGQGALAVRLASDYNYLGLEPDPESYETASARLAALGRGEVRCGSTELVELDRTFDLIASFEVIEHIEDDGRALASWVELLRPGGTLVVSTPGYQARFGPMDAAVGHFRRYEPSELAATLAAAGLDDVVIRHYAMPLGYAIEAVRNAVARHRQPTDGVSTMAERTGRSGRFLQPAGRAAGLVIGLGTIPFRYVQRWFPDRGPVLVARARRPQLSGTRSG